MSRPLQIGLAQLTMGPLDKMLESARVMDQAGVDTVWLAEAYPWVRNPASVTVTSRRTAALEGRLPAAARAWRQ
jgi:alkanesulfonate monooxygenase SsuD/methylene tetrahydromethanopterin reductase-like flavin-dependent oxidoreductase (luciferase family)